MTENTPATDVFEHLPILFAFVVAVEGIVQSSRTGKPAPALLASVVVFGIWMYHRQRRKKSEA